MLRNLMVLGVASFSLVSFADRAQDLLLKGNAPITFQGCKLGIPFNVVQYCTENKSLCPVSGANDFVFAMASDWKAGDMASQFFTQGSSACLVSKFSPTSPIQCGRFGNFNHSYQPEVQNGFVAMPFYWKSLRASMSHSSARDRVLTEGRALRKLLVGPAKNEKLVEDYQYVLRVSSIGLNQLPCHTEFDFTRLPQLAQHRYPGNSGFLDTLEPLFERADNERSLFLHRNEAPLPGSYHVRFKGNISEYGFVGLEPLADDAKHALQYVIFDYHSKDDFKFAGFNGANRTIVIGKFERGSHSILAEAPLFHNTPGLFPINPNQFTLYVQGSRVTLSHYSVLNSYLPPPMLLVSYEFPNYENLSDGQLGYGANINKPLILSQYDIIATTQSVPSQNSGAKLVFEQTFDGDQIELHNLLPLGWKWTGDPKFAPKRYPYLSYVYESHSLATPVGDNWRWENFPENNAFAVGGTAVGFEYERANLSNVLVAAYMEGNKRAEVTLRRTTSSRVGAAVEEAANGGRTLVVFKEAIAANGKATRKNLKAVSLPTWNAQYNSLKPMYYQGWIWFSAEGSALKVYLNGSLALETVDPLPVAGKVGFALGDFGTMDNLAIYQLPN